MDIQSQWIFKSQRILWGSQCVRLNMVLLVASISFAGCSSEKKDTVPAASGGVASTGTTTPTPNEGNAATSNSAATKDMPSNTEPSVEMTGMELLQKIGELTQTAVQSPNPDYDMLIEAGTLAEKLTQKGEDLDESAKRLVSTAFYNQACGYAKKSEKDNAFASLDKALALGFDEFNLLTEDPDLQSLRDDERFSKLKEKSKEAEKMAIEAKVDEAFASTSVFPFDFELENVNGEKLALEKLRGSKVTIVDVWGTWCPPCRMEIPHFVELHNKLEAKGLQIIGINYERGDKEAYIPKIKSFAEETGIKYPLVIGDEATQSQIPDFQGYPTTLFLDSEGKVRAKTVGYHPMEVLEGIVMRIMEKG